MPKRIQALIETDIAFHRAAQYLAKIGIAFLPKEEDDSHTNLGWNTERKRIEGRWVEGQAGEFRLTIDPIDYELRWENRGRNPVDRICLHKTSVEDVNRWWIQSTLAICGRDLTDLKLHYELPSSELYQLDHFPALDAQSILDWIHWRSHGQRWIKNLESVTDSPVEARIWPHHFDTGIYTQTDSEMAIGAGVAMADEMVTEPYIYIYGWKGDQKTQQKGNDSSIGTWKVGEWSGYIIRYSEYIKQPRMQIGSALKGGTQHILDSAAKE